MKNLHDNHPTYHPPIARKAWNWADIVYLHKQRGRSYLLCSQRMTEYLCDLSPYIGDLTPQNNKLNDQLINYYYKLILQTKGGKLACLLVMYLLCE